MNAMALPLLGMLACVLAELYFLRVTRGAAIPWRELVLNLNSGHILMWLFRGVEIAAFAWTLNHSSLHWTERWHPFAVWMVTLFAWDLGFYCMHRLHHAFPLLWSVHVVHHEGEHYNLSLGIRNAWISSLTTLPFTTIPLAVLGVPLSVFVGVSTLHYTVQFYNHNNIVGRSGWLERFLVTPAHHRVHHGQNREYLDRNFGGTFLLWDRLFGSFQPARADVPIRYGVAHPTASSNPLWVNVVPLMCHARLPLPRLTRTARVAVPDAVIGVGGLLLFGVVAYYIHRDGTWPPHAQPLFFTIIFVATIVLGAMSDGRAWSMPCWVVLALAALVVMPLWFGLRDATGLALLAAWLAHGLATAFFVALRAHRKAT